MWASATNGQGGDRAEVQTDGNFVLYAGQADLAQRHQGQEGPKLVIQDDRNVVLYAADGPAWSTRTETDAPPPPVVEDVEVAPVAVESRPAAASRPRTYTVVSGDTLFAIAERFYGDGNRYPEIAAASGIANPDLINVGRVITIP